ncbi:MAG: DUF721 domain-containing protein [Planctomycetia bacterium]|nr:DUF721 domain-containing protein [Planctomycetia bacterium]
MRLPYHRRVRLRDHAVGRRVDPWPSFPSGLAGAWQQAAPENMRDLSQPGLVRRGVLDVFVSHSALVQEMGFSKRQIIATLNELVPAEGITDIRCRLMADAGR